MTNPILRPPPLTDDHTLAIMAASTARYMCALSDFMQRMEDAAEESGDPLEYDFDYAQRALVKAVVEVDEVLEHARIRMADSEGVPW